jgi:hypothetical protein
MNQIRSDRLGAARLAVIAVDGLVLVLAAVSWPHARAVPS